MLLLPLRGINLLNAKQIRYAVIKGKAERINELLKPVHLRSSYIKSRTEDYINHLLKNLEDGITDDIDFYIQADDEGSA